MKRLIIFGMIPLFTFLSIFCLYFLSNYVCIDNCLEYKEAIGRGDLDQDFCVYKYDSCIKSERIYLFKR